MMTAERSGLAYARPQRGYTDQRSAVDGSEVDHQDLIGDMAEQIVQRSHQFDPPAVGQVSAEDGVLQVVP
jgi:hypothetical protein